MRSAVGEMNGRAKLGEALDKGQLMARILPVAFLVASASLCSANALTGLLQYDFGYATYFSYEGVVFLVEAVLIKAFTGVAIRTALLVSLVANVLSLAVGMLPGINPLIAYVLGILGEVLVVVVLLRKNRPGLVAMAVLGINFFTLLCGSWIVVEFVPPRAQLSIECGHNLHLIGDALHEYARANDGWLPAAEDFSELKTSLTRYMPGNDKAFTCPLAQSIVDDRGYVWNSKLSGRSLEDFPNKSPEIVAIIHLHNCRPPFHNHELGHVLYLDGHVGPIIPRNVESIVSRIPVRSGK